MHVDENDLRRDLFQQGIGNTKRIVARAHEYAALQIDDGIFLSRGEFTLIETIARCSGNVVRWANYPPRSLMAFGRHGLHVFDDLALVPNMIAGCNHVRSKIE